MKILYTSCYPDESFSRWIKNKVSLSYAAQKFNKLLVRGFALNGIDADVIQFTPDAVDEPDGELTEEYNGQKIRFLRHKRCGGRISSLLKRRSFLKEAISRYKTEEPDGIVVVDALAANAYSVTRLAKRRGLRVVTVITDFVDDPGKIKAPLLTKMKMKLQARQFYKQFEYTDLFFLLTESMLEKIPQKQPKYIVSNGVCDNALYDVDALPLSQGKRICMYTGEIRKMYGIHNLVEAFCRVNGGRAELHLYGFGMNNYPDLMKTLEENGDVKYMGVRPNEEIVRLQREATFLINPRLVSEYGEYVKYSFPSKHIEYMTTGHPVITTRLPCIGKEYEDSVYFFDTDSVDGMARTLDGCLSLPDGELLDRGARARAFVLDRMNNKTVARRILDALLG